MAEELQNLLEKIKREGVDKANAEAAAIIAKAKADAAALVKDAEGKAAALKTAAEAEAAVYSERAAETIRQAARDTVLKVEASVTGMLVKLLSENVDKTLGDPAVAAPIAAEAVKALVTGGKASEVAASAKLAEAMRSQLAGAGNFTVITDEALSSGFAVRLDGGRVEHDFTGAAVAAALAERLRPDLAKLVSGV